MIALHDGIWTTENPRGIATDRTESRNDPLFALIGVFNAWRRDVARSELPVRNCPFGIARSDFPVGDLPVRICCWDLPKRLNPSGYGFSKPMPGVPSGAKMDGSQVAQPQ